MIDRVSRRRENILTTAVIVLYAVTAALLMYKTFFLPETFRSVWINYREAGENWARRAPLYDGGYQYFPPVTLLFYYLVKLPSPWSLAMWNVVNYGGLLAGMIIFARQFFAGFWRSLFALAVLPIIFESLINQQANALIAGMLMAGAALLARANYVGAALQTLAGIIKIAPLAFPLLVAAIFPRKIIFYLILTIILVTGFFCLYDVDYAARCFHEWQSRLSAKANAPYYRDAFALWKFVETGKVPDGSRYFEMRNYHLVQIAMAGFAFLFTLKVRYINKWNNASSVAFAFCAAGWWLLLFGPSTEIASAAIAAGGAAFMPIYALLKNRGKVLALIAYLWLALGAIGDVEWRLCQWFPGNDFPKIILPLGSVLFGIWLFGCWVRENYKLRNYEE